MQEDGCLPHCLPQEPTLAEVLEANLRSDPRAELVPVPCDGEEAPCARRSQSRHPIARSVYPGVFGSARSATCLDSGTRLSELNGLGKEPEAAPSASEVRQEDRGEG